MNILKSIFGKKDTPVRSYADFWTWFQTQEKKFFTVVQTCNESREIERGFFDIMGPKLDELKKGYFYLTGMYDDHTVELILTADSNTKQIVFVEELVAAAPSIPGWRLTALKPALDIADVGINMDGYTFNQKNLHFYANDLPQYPDEIDITIVSNDYNEENKKTIVNGIHIFLDNYLGELSFVNDIDQLTIISAAWANKELIPIYKLKEYLHWRQKEFIEKYEGTLYDLQNDLYSVFETELSSGNIAVAFINTGLLEWDGKASHPWIAKLTIQFDGSNNNGLPKQEDSEAMNLLEEELLLELKDHDGWVYVGRETADDERDVYLPCKDFRMISNLLFKFQQARSGHFIIKYDIYKDKYWQSFTRFMDDMP